jgi:hypothetical protein
MYCPPNAALLREHAKQKTFKMVVYQRDLSRKLANEEDALRMLREKLSESDWEIQVGWVGGRLGRLGGV